MKLITYKTKCFCQTSKLHSRITGEIQFEVPEKATDEQIAEIRDTEIFGWMTEQIESGPIGQIEKVK